MNLRCLISFLVANPAGATYPLDKSTEAEFMRALEDRSGGLQAGVVGESGSRLLAGAAARPFFLESSIVGISRS